jgi:hypothetical protein
MDTATSTPLPPGTALRHAEDTAAPRFYAAQGLANKATRFSCAVPTEVAA